MKFIYSLNPGDLFRIYFRYHFQNTKTAYFFFIAMEILLINNAKTFPGSYIVILCLPLLFFLVSIRDVYSFVKKRMIPAISGNYTLEIKEGAMHITDDEGNLSSIRLGFIISVQKKKHSFILVFKNMNQMFFPYHMFATKEEEEAFFQLINHHMGTMRKIDREDMLDS